MFSQELHERLQLRELILGERLRWKQVQRAGRGILEDRVQYRRVVAERLAGCGRRDGDDVAAAKDVRKRFRLVRVELIYPAARERRLEPRVDAVRVGGKRRRDRRQTVRRGDDRVRPVPAHRGAGGRQAAEDLLQRTVFVSGDSRKGLLRHGKY